MTKNLILTTILKDCPKDMELDCTMFDNVHFKRIDNGVEYPIVISVDKTDIVRLTKEGCWNKYPNAKCVIFPKGKTSWEGFHRPFIDGDIIVDKQGSIAIYKQVHESYEEPCVDFHCRIYHGNENLFHTNIIKGSLEHCGEIDSARFATEEEKLKLFQAIKDNGYKWNAETKTLEKVLKEDKEFKNGDIIVSEFGNIAIFSHTEKNDRGRNVVYYHCLYSHGSVGKFKAGVGYGIGYVEDCRFATEYEKKLMMDAVRKYGFHWNPETKTLEKLLPKFKIGNTIQSKTDNNDEFTIIDIDNGCYYGRGKGHEFLIPIIKQDNWELKLKYKFKVGDKIRHKDSENILKIDEIDMSGSIYCCGSECVWRVDQDNYELVPDKFDIKTLNHFDKVLVRQYDLSAWCVDFFSYYDKEGGYVVCTGEIHYDYCVPYNDDTKHLVGKIVDAPEFYRYWEK